MRVSNLSKPSGWSKEFTRRFGILAALVAALVSPHTQAVHFVNVEDPSHNTEPPADPAQARLWHLQGDWNAFLGTPIAAYWFITAKHVGGSLGDQLQLMGKPYTAIVRIPDPESDLALWGVATPFPDQATLYQGSRETSRRVVLFGKGPARGEAVWVETNETPVLKGWKWGKQHKVRRWGENVIDQIEVGPYPRGRKLGELLVAFFDLDGLPSEAGLSGGDSGGAMFLWSNRQWQLAGIHYAAGGVFKLKEGDEPFDAMLFDERGLHRRNWSEEEGETWPLTALDANPQPGPIVATRISHRASWIQQQITTFANPLEAIVVESAERPDGPYVKVDQWTLHTHPLGLVVDKPDHTRFFRVKSTTALRMLAPRQEGAQLILPFDG